MKITSVINPDHMFHQTIALHRVQVKTMPQHVMLFFEVTDGRKALVPGVGLVHMTLGTPVSCSTN